MELSEARETLQYMARASRVLAESECSSSVEAKRGATAIDTILTALDAATQDAQRQRERAEKAEGERDRLVEAWPTLTNRHGASVWSEPTDGDIEWWGDNAEIRRRNETETEKKYPVKRFATKADAVRFAAGLPAKGAAE